MLILVSLLLRITSLTVAIESVSHTLNTAGTSTENSPPSIQLRNTNLFICTDFLIAKEEEEDSPFQVRHPFTGSQLLSGSSDQEI